MLFSYVHSDARVDDAEAARRVTTARGGGAPLAQRARGRHHRHDAAAATAAAALGGHRVMYIMADLGGPPTPAGFAERVLVAVRARADGRGGLEVAPGFGGGGARGGRYRFEDDRGALFGLHVCVEWGQKGLQDTGSLV